MVIQSVAMQAPEPTPPAGSEHPLWLGGGDVLTITLNRDSDGFPPDSRHLTPINKMIRGLAQAAKSVIYHSENDEAVDMILPPVEDLADAIVLLSQLADGVRHEIERGEG